MRASEFDQAPAAGCILLARDTGRWGLQQRSNSVTDPGVWSTWGGGREPGETEQQCVLRELAEESGYQGTVELRSLANNGRYHTFVALVPQEFEPRLNSESQNWCWVNPGQWPKPLHPDLAKILTALNENFADGRKPGRKGLSKRVGIPKKPTLTQLSKIAKSSTGERRRMAQWQLNMRRGKAKNNK